MFVFRLILGMKAKTVVFTMDTPRLTVLNAAIVFIDNVDWRVEITTLRGLTLRIAFFSFYVNYTVSSFILLDNDQNK